MNYDSLEPQKVFSYFKLLSSAPHGSGNTAQISALCADFARAHGLEYHMDSNGSLIIIKPASDGCEGAPPLIIQGHLDMVCDAAPDCAKDMSAEGLDLRCGDGFVYAEGTSLGGDDCIAVAMALALLDDDGLAHPRLEVVLTVDEEVGMSGARDLDASPLTARRMINIDSENEGVFTVGCAGGSRCEITLPADCDTARREVLALRLHALKGGHSGMEIDAGRGNANILLARIVDALPNARLVRFCGGGADNAIPSEAEAEICVPDAASAELAALEAFEAVKLENAAAEPDIALELTRLGEGERRALTQSDSRRALDFLLLCPNGVQEYSADIDGLVQTSLNLGIVSVTKDGARFTLSLRSSVPTQMAFLKRRLALLAARLGGEFCSYGDYPAWEFRRVSPLRDVMTEVFREQYGRDPEIEIIHAGLECGLLSQKLPDLDCVSIGPNLYDIHSYRERLEIASVQRLWRYVRGVVEALAKDA